MDRSSGRRRRSNTTQHQRQRWTVDQVRPADAAWVDSSCIHEHVATWLHQRNHHTLASGRRRRQTTYVRLTDMINTRPDYDWRDVTPRLTSSYDAFPVPLCVVSSHPPSPLQLIVPWLLSVQPSRRPPAHRLKSVIFRSLADFCSCF